MKDEHSYDWDVFISHASEDKESVARPLASALRSYGLRVWYDEFSLELGDSLRKGLEVGLSRSKFGIVIVSPSFIGKQWTERELSLLYSLEAAYSERRILPIWHQIERDEVVKGLPMLADIIALKTATLRLDEIVEKIITVTRSLSDVDLSLIQPTGFTILDSLIGGGLPRPSTIALTGEKGIGKSTLATQIQIASLFRGEPCIYISYREAPFDVISRFKRLQAPIEDFITKGIFRIIDNFSELNGISKSVVNSYLGNKILSDGIVRIENPENADHYFKTQLMLWDEMGTGGINIIDSVNERYDIMNAEERNLHFMRFRARIKLMEKSAIHIVTETDDHYEYNKIMKDIQGGEFRMYSEIQEGITLRRIRFGSLRDGKYPPSTRDFTITDHGIEIF